MPGLFDDLIPNPTVDRVSRGILGEEKGTPKSVSPQGARGTGQIEPGTFKQYALPGESINNDKDNRAVHRRMIYDFVVHKKMDPGQAATAYFSGEGNVARGGATPWKQDRSDINESTSSYVYHAERGMKPARRLFEDLIPKTAAAPKKGLFDDLIPKQEPWRVPKANEGQVVHARRGLDMQGPQQGAAPVSDPEITARQKQAGPVEGLNVEKRAWEMLRNDPMAFFKKLGSAILEEGKGVAEPLTLSKEAAQGKLDFGDPETQRRVIGAGMELASGEAPGGVKGLAGRPRAIEAGAPKEIPVDKSTPRVLDSRAGAAGQTALERELTLPHEQQQKLQGYVDDLRKRMGIEIAVPVNTTPRIPTKAAGEAVVSGPGFAGGGIKYEPAQKATSSSIYVNPALSPRSQLAVATHEFGHLVQYAKFDQLPNEERGAIYEAWTKAVDKRGLTADELRGPVYSKALEEDFGHAPTEAGLKYNKEFAEWFANETAKFLQTNKTAVGVADKFFKGIADMWRNLYEHFTGRKGAVPEIEAFMRKHGEFFEEEGAAPASIGAATTPLSQIVEHNLKTFNDDNAKTPGFKESLRSATNAIKSFTAPETITDPLTGAKTGQEAAAIFRRREGQETRTAFRARAAMDKFSKFTNSLNLDEQLSMIKWMQKPDETEWKLNIPPEARQFAETFKKWMDTYKRKLQALPQTEQMEFRENYVPQMWKQPDQARAALFSPARTGNKGFTKQHVFDDYEEGIRAGFVPVSTNPMEIFSRYVENAAKFIADKEIINDAKEADLMRQQPIGTAPPEGWLPVNARSQPGTQLYAPKGFAEVYNNVRSSLPQGSKGDLLKGVQFVANKVTSVKLALSYFHAMLETGVSWASGLANAITLLARGSPAAAGLELVKTPFKPFTSYFAARKAWATYLNGEFVDPQMRRIVRGLVNANFDFLREGQLADEYRASRLPGFIKSWERGRLQQQARDAFANIKARPLTGTASEVYDLAMRSVQTVLEPVFQYYVPWLKTQAAVDAAKTVLESRPDITPLEFDAECRKISDNMDARFGEMNRNNIFWSQTQKAIAQAMLLSYSYTYGLAKNALGASFDIARLPSRAVMKARGMSNEMIWTDRMSFAIGLPVTVVLTNAIYQYLKTGNAPQTLDQAVQKPKTGGTNEGQPERATIPSHINSYRNFFLNPAEDMFNKLNPLWQTMIELGENKDYREKQIVDPQDPVVKKIIDGAKFAAAQMGTPVAFEGQADKKAGSNISGLETFFGIRSAGMRDTNPDQFNQMMNYKDSEAKFKAREAEINDRRVRAGKPRLIFKHNDQQKIIHAYMQHPEKDPLAAFDTGYGGEQ